MEREARKRHLPFLTAKSRAISLYGIEISDDDFILLGYDVWREIGNIATIQNRYFVKVPDDFIIELPTQTEFVQSVTLVDRPEIITSFDSGGAKDRNIASYQEKSNLPELNQSITSSPGKSVNYMHQGNNTIKITSQEAMGKDLMIVYKTIDTDEDGLPILNDKEVAAIAAEVSKRLLFRRAFQGVGLKDKNMALLLQTISAEADRLMVAAKIDEKINSDFLDKLLDVTSSWDRKQYGRRKNLIN